MEKGRLQRYFNRETRFPIANTVALSGVVLGLLFMGTTASTFFALGSALLAAGYANKWKESATGTPFWKPKTPFYGL